MHIGIYLFAGYVGIDIALIDVCRSKVYIVSVYEDGDYEIKEEEAGLLSFIKSRKDLFEEQVDISISTIKDELNAYYYPEEVLRELKEKGIDANKEILIVDPKRALCI